MGETYTDAIGPMRRTGVVKIRSRKTDKTAIQYTGDNLSEIAEWSENHVLVDGSDGKAKVATNEGLRDLAIDWWVIRGVIGEYYPCDPRVFEQSYMILEDFIGDDEEETE